MKVTLNGKQWLPADMVLDLAKVGLKADFLVLRNQTDSFYAVEGSYNGIDIVVLYAFLESATFVILHLSSPDDSLVEAFSKVLGKTPFCKYYSTSEKQHVFEWDFTDANMRFAELSIARDVVELERLDL